MTATAWRIKSPQKRCSVTMTDQQKTPHQKYYEANKAELNAYRTRKRHENAEREKEVRRAHYAKNKDKICEQRRALRKANVEAAREYDRKRYSARRKEKHRAYKLKSQFNLTVEQYEAMSEVQNGKCASCGEEQIIYDKFGNLRRLAVDHDHATGEVRQLLCNTCNVALGMINDDVRKLQCLIEYVKRHKPQAN